jgi:hypothetical protein
MASTEELLSQIDEKLHSVVQLLAMSITQGEGSLAEKARKLQKAGMAPKDIAVLFDTTANTISVQLSKVKRQAKSGTKAAAKKK